MKKKDVRKYFFSSMWLTLCFCFVCSMFLTVDYNNRKLSGKSVAAESSLVESINKNEGENSKTFFERFIFPLEEFIAGASDKIMDFFSGEK